MANTILNTFFHRTEQSDAAYDQRVQVYLKILAFIGFAFLIFGGGDAMAQSVDGLCKFAGWLKSAATVAAIIAIFLIVMNSFFGKSSVVGDVIMTVIIGCVVVFAAPQIIALTGLTSGCSV